MTKDDIRGHILEVAGAIFAAEGYQNATVRKICAQADVNVAAINYYFGDKERLYIEAVKNARVLIEKKWPLPDWPNESSAGPCEVTQAEAERRLRTFIETFLRRLLYTEPQAWQMRLLLRETLDPTRAGEELAQEGFQPFFEVLVDILRRLVPATVAESRFHQLGFSIISQCVFYRFHHRMVELMISAEERAEAFQVESLAEHIYEFSWGAIRSMSADLASSAGPDRRASPVAPDKGTSYGSN
jgi:TetR/AcrR family transcriptional regulator, regulator of cefoperazone and chloramphenicol sensitivity